MIRQLATKRAQAAWTRAKQELDRTSALLKQDLVAVREWTFVLGPGTAGLNAILLGTLAQFLFPLPWLGKLDGRSKQAIELHYAGEDKLFVPVDRAANRR